MPGTSSRDRLYSAPIASHNLGFSYLWSPDAIISGGGAPTTGAWVPATASANGSISVVADSGSYTFFNAAITGSQTTIPLGAISWSVYVASGVGFVNGVPYNTPASVNGGGYDGSKRLSAPITVGCTGSAASPSRVIVSYET